MRASCVLTADELAGEKPDLIVFPEEIAPVELQRAEAMYPDAIIVGAPLDCGHPRGVLRHSGKDRIRYVKVCSSGPGSGDISQRPIYETNDVCIGVVICMDIQCGPFFRGVSNQVRASSAPLKIICIPADMDAFWFTTDELANPYFEGVHVVLCNHVLTHPKVRCPSFATDTYRQKTIKQRRTEPIHFTLG